MSQYVDRTEASASYRPKAGTMSPGLKRAREPFRFRNTFMGVALGALAAGIWAYSISAVKQDVFDDIDEEADALSRSRAASASRDQVTIGSALSTPDSVTAAEAQPTSPKLPTPAPPPKGVLQYLDSRFPRLLDPQNKTLVWGAPPVDNLGTTSGTKSS
ncbi:hypothetical protein AMATHDRAFT_155125 [Amanita thiersii Skay4041]|uniref:Cytochrome c oxidase assembly factor 3 n=1 Tax=Amanita thiersii Skay4041 TaxID=703135 RepID=A0A2A9N913_9AGAR|nr:hypothetical protein AMATHDRAFT_155125 [Amanita thiersii Skay4041]